MVPFTFILDLTSTISLCSFVGNKKQKEGKSVLLRIARRNGRDLSTAELQEIDEILGQMAFEGRGSKKGAKLSPLHMFKRHYISRTVILILGWTCTCVGYYRSVVVNSLSFSY